MKKNEKSFIDPPPREIPLSKIILTTVLAFSLILSLSLTACGKSDEGGGGGELKITGIPVAYAGKYIDGAAFSPVMLAAYAELNTSNTYAKIDSSGNATLTVLKVDDSGNTSGYTGNDEIPLFALMIHETAEGSTGPGIARAAGKVKFSGGKAEVDVSSWDWF